MQCPFNKEAAAARQQNFVENANEVLFERRRQKMSAAKQWRWPDIFAAR
jgi:hypothetical protein